jgi:hypothetical protein
MGRTRKNLRRLKKGGNHNNWRPTRNARKPLYLNTQIKLEETLRKYMEGDTLDLSSYQNDLISGTDRKKEEARDDLNKILRYLKREKEDLKSISLNVGILVASGIAVGVGLAVLESRAIDLFGNVTKRAVNEIKVKLSINDIIQTIEKLLKETDVETTTVNPLVYKKAKNSAKAANIVEKDGLLVVKKGKNSFEPTPTH